MAENEKGNGAGEGAPPPEKPPTEGAKSPSEGAKSPEAIAETPEAKAERLERERGEAHDRMLRVAAEFENWKKRARKESEEAQARGREQLAKEILPVLDNLERALQAVTTGGTVEQLGQGVKLVDKQLHGVLEKFEVKSFEALGEPFDPAKHEAIQQVETSDHAPGAVAKVFARGYLIGSRLLRPAMVAVAKAPAAAEAGTPGEGDPQP
jgi:molecular chaperone GrpE